MKRIYFFLMVCLLTIGKMFATDKVTDYTYLLIWNSDSTYNVYKCAERPVVIPTAECLLLRINGTEIQYPINEARKFTFGKTEDFESGVKNPEANALYEITPNMVRITGVKKAGSAGIFSTDGKCMMQGKSQEGEITFDITSLKSGVYVIKCGTENFKFLKK